MVNYGKRKGKTGKRSYGRRIVRRPTKKGLTKVEAKEVKTIAKRTINKMAESKYFDANFIQGQGPSVAWYDVTTGDKSEISVYAFQTSYNRQVNPSSSEINVYGQEIDTGGNVNVSNLRMNKVFQSDAANESLRAFQIDGQTVRPSFAECKWHLNYFAQNTSLDYTKGLAYCVRMIRVRPRALKTSFTTIDPENDLFLTNANQPFGIQSQVDGEFIYSREDFYLGKINSRKYQVIEDKFMNLMPSGVYNTLDSSTFVTQTNTASQRTLTTKHDLGKELYYPNAGDTSSTRNAYPSTGTMPEFVFFHCCAIGLNTINDQPQHMLISARAVSTFKDM